MNVIQGYKMKLFIIKKIILSFIFGAITYIIMFYFSGLFLTRIVPLSFLVFLIPPVISGFVASKTYSNGIIGCAIIGFFCPFFPFFIANSFNRFTIYNFYYVPRTYLHNYNSNNLYALSSVYE